MVKYSAPQSSQIAIEDITPTGWDEHFEDNMTLTSPVTSEEFWETPNDENDFLEKYTAPQSAQVSIKDIIPTGWDDLIEYLSQPTEVPQPGLSYPAEYLAHPEGSTAHLATKEVNAMEDEEDNCNWSNWIFPTHNNGLNNWEAEDVISFNH